MKFIYAIIFTILTTAYVIFRNSFVPISFYNEYFFVAGMIAGMFIAGLGIDIIQTRFLERLKISKSVFLFIIFSLLFALLFYWTEDLLGVAAAADYYKNPTSNIEKYSSLQNIFHFGGGILGLIVATILAPLLFKTNILIGFIFLLLGMWAQWGLGYGVYITYPLSIIIFLALGLHLRYKNKLQNVH